MDGIIIGIIFFVPLAILILFVIVAKKEIHSKAHVS